MRWRRIVAIGAALLVTAAAACGDDKPKEAEPSTTTSSTAAAGGITVTSTAFKEGGRIPEKFSCQGDNVPPPLSWSGVPSGSSSVAVMVTDPDAPKGVFVHWIVTGLPASGTGTIGEGDLPSGAHTEANSTGQAVYTGMCPPSGAAHRYIFEVVALGQTVTFPAEATPQDKVQLLRSASSAGGKLTGTFGR